MKGFTQPASSTAGPGISAKKRKTIRSNPLKLATTYDKITKIPGLGKSSILLFHFDGHRRDSSKPFFRKMKILESNFVSSMTSIT